MTEVDKLVSVEVAKKPEEEELVLHRQQEEHPLGNYSYFCKICSKRFVSGRALGGHMRAHGPVTMAEPGEKKRMLFKSLEEEEGEEEELNGDQLYTLRRNPKRSWRFSDQEYPFMMGTQSQEEDGSTESESEAEIEQHPASENYPNEYSRSFDMWMKGKRSRRPRYAIQSQSNHEEQFSSDTNEEEDMALCLVMLASGVNTATQKLEFHGGEQQPGFPRSSDLKVPKINNALELSKCIKKRPKTKMVDANVDPSDDKKTRYECTTCNKTFYSYQALGGHRASHKKVKGCFSRIDGMEENESLEEEITDEEPISRSADSQLPNDFPKPSAKEQTKRTFDDAREESGETTLQPGIPSSVKKTRIHECSICHRTFASGQALGGHKRCHWGSAGNSDTISTVSSTKEPPVQQQRPMRPEMLDLNLPAPVDDDSEARELNVLGVNVKNSQKPLNAETHSKMSPPFFQSWWMGTYPKQGHFLYNNHALMSIEDEADSKLGKKIDFGGVEDLKVSSRLQPWLQL